MAQVVLLRGVNVGGHRTFRPSMLAAALKHLDVVNIGAAGTFVVQQPVQTAALRAEFARRLPFDAEIMICQGRDIARVLAHDAYADHPPRPDVVRFVTVLARAPRSGAAMPMRLPASGQWLLQIVAREKRFVFGVYRRHMKTIGYLGALDRIFGVPATTRNWNTIAAIGKVLARAGE
jgi:uncharacterized protein (DUF1697 family)